MNKVFDALGRFFLSIPYLSVTIVYWRQLKAILTNENSTEESRRSAFAEIQRLNDLVNTIASLIVVHAILLVALCVAQVNFTHAPGAIASCEVKESASRASADQPQAAAIKPPASRPSGEVDRLSTTQRSASPSELTETERVPSKVQPTTQHSPCTQAASLPSSSSVAWGAAGAAVIWSSAWFAVGFSAGFLFGIPRSQTGSGQTIDSQRTSQTNDPHRLTPNTNLEQISDWLTKLIVALGLVSISSFGGKIRTAATYMTGSEGCSIACHSLAMAVIIVFTLYGLVAGYLLTRLVLANAFNRADRGLTTPAFAPSSLSGATSMIFRETLLGTSSSNPTAPKVDPQVRTKADAVLKNPVSDSTFTTRRTFAEALIVAGRNEEAVKRFQDLVREQPNNLRLRLDLVRAMWVANQAWTPDLASAVSYLYDARTQAQDFLRTELYELLTYLFLYNVDSSGYVQTRFLAREYLLDPVNRPSTAIYINAACAAGQLFAAGKQSQSESDRRRLAEEAIKYLIRAIQIEPRSVPRVNQLISAKPTDEDNDLVNLIDFAKQQNLFNELDAELKKVT